MRCGAVLARLPGTLALAGLVLFCLAAQDRDLQNGRRVCVVAIRDSSLFTLCGSAAANDVFVPLDGRSGRPLDISQILMIPGTGMIRVPPSRLPALPSMLDRSHPDWEMLARADQAVCPSGWVDTGIQKKMEKEFSKRNDFQVVNSPQAADIVFLEEAWYFPGQVVANGKVVETPLQAAVAVVVPAEIYRSHPAESEALLKARLWAGFVSRVAPNLSAEPAELVGQFVKNRKWPANIPSICGAWQHVSAAQNSGPRQRFLNGADAGEANPKGAPEMAAGTGAGVIKVDVSLVTVPVIASDPNGRFVPDLGPHDFRLFEDEREMPIDRVIPESEPFNVALLLDVSNSTHFKLADIQTAAMGFVDSLRPDDRVMIVSFGSFIFVHSEFTADRRRLRAAIVETSTSGGTRLYDAVDLAVSERLNRVQGRKAIVLFTDGVDSQSRLASYASTLARIEESNVLVYAVRYDTHEDIQDFADPKAYARGLQYLNGLSANSGGILLDANTVPSLTEAFTRIAEELRHQYAICYYPGPAASNASIRRIRVETLRPEVRIRARKGYRVRLPEDIK